MNQQDKVLVDNLPLKSGRTPDEGYRLPRAFLVATVALIACFAKPLYELFRFSADENLYSHILLVPFISAYLAWLKRKEMPAPSGADPAIGIISGLSGLALIAWYWSIHLSGQKLALEDSLAMTTLSFLLLFVSVCAWFLGRPLVRAVAFPLSFLLFMFPIPGFLMAWIEIFLQHGSAQVTYALFTIAGTPVYFHELVFQLAPIRIQVAPECSGIHSTMALMMTSLLAGHFFLRSTGKRTLLTLAVVPLALVRNGLRIFTIGELCVHIGPHMINSYIHVKGGPIFFGLSLIPFFLLLMYLVKLDRRTSPATPAADPARKLKP